jgi:dihydrofolate synthase/folylpolyglutamate synthase
MDLLGDTLGKIAMEKAGIIKSGIPVVISETQDESKDIFLKKASDSESDIYFADQNYECRLGKLDYQTGVRQFTLFDKISRRSFTGEIPIGGDYQSKNIQAVFQACSILKGNFGFTEDIVMRGIENVVRNTGLMGRWQIIGRKPLVICDTGHNREGLEYVISQLAAIQSRNLRMVIGFVSDKDLNSIMTILPEGAIYYFARASVPRALDEQTLSVTAGLYGLKGRSFPDVRSAVSAARKEADPDDIIFIGGSTFVVADAL